MVFTFSDTDRSKSRSNAPDDTVIFCGHHHPTWGVRWFLAALSTLVNKHTSQSKILWTPYSWVMIYIKWINISSYIFTIPCLGVGHCHLELGSSLHQTPAHVRLRTASHIPTPTTSHPKMQNVTPMHSNKEKVATLHDILTFCVVPRCAMPRWTIGPSPPLSQGIQKESLPNRKPWWPLCHRWAMESWNCLGVKHVFFMNVYQWLIFWMSPGPKAPNTTRARCHIRSCQINWGKN